ncbi:hypothetical protein J7L85_04950 [candidate division WOR-3 bacterium]|nr:hypothetical protein [candidate division WOR-3 bacterium]
MMVLLLLSMSFEAMDTPNDGGQSITIIGRDIPTDVKKILVFRRTEKDTVYKQVGFFSLLSMKYTDNDSIKDGEKYFYRLGVVFPKSTFYYNITKPAVSTAQWFNRTRAAVLMYLILFSALVLLFIQLAKRNPEGLFIRKIPALDAIDEAIGRSTELGKPTFFVHGLMGITDAATLAAITLLRRVAKKIAEYDTPLLVTNFDPIVMTASQETVKQAYTEAGRPDAYNEKNIIYLTYEQFGYTAGVDGLMAREKPGAIFLQGYFFAESLILAETGHAVGAIQIAGTTATVQLPFFVAACDYVLIGEELLAASSYIGREPVMLGSVKGSDWGKAVLIFIIGAYVTLGTIAGILMSTGRHTLMHIFEKLVSVF